MTLTHRLTWQHGPALRRLAAALALGLSALLLLSACASPAPADYASQAPVLDLRQYFDGKLPAHGIVTDRSGLVTQRFTVQINASWVGDVGTLEEQFFYSDGRRDKRIWTLTRSLTTGCFWCATG